MNTAAGSAAGPTKPATPPVCFEDSSLSPLSTLHLHLINPSATPYQPFTP